MTLLIVAIGAGLGTMLRYLTVTFWSTKPQYLTAILRLIWLVLFLWAY